MSEASRRNRITITLGRSGQVVSRDGSDLELEDEVPRVGTKRSVKERLGIQLDSDAVGKRQRGEASFSGNDLQISQSDLRFKLLQRNAQRRTQSDVGGSSMDLREKLLSKSEQPPPPRSLDSRPRMPDPRDVTLPPLRSARGPTQMLSSSSHYSPRTLDDIPRRSPERLVSRGRSPPRNARSYSGGGARAAVSPPRDAGRINGYPRDLSPSRNTRSFSGGGSRDARSPPRHAGRILGRPRDLSPPRHAGRTSSHPRDVSPPRHAGRTSGHPRDLSPPRTSGRISSHLRDLSASPPRNAGRVIGHPRDLSPPRTAGRTTGHPRDLSPPRHTGRVSGHPRDLSVSPHRNAGRTVGHPRDLSPLRDSGRITSHPRGLSPPRNAGRMITHPRGLSPPRTAGGMISHPRDLSPPRNASNFSSGYRTMSPTRNVGSSYMSSSRVFSPPRNPGSYMGSSMGSPPSRRMDDFTGRNRMLDDVRASPYGVSGVPNSQAIANGFSRPMLPPPVPNPYPLPPLSQLPPFGSIMQNSPFPVEEPLTVDSFLDSLGLGRYSLAFKREEVDMNTIKQMKESDLKDLIIPMGPRKRILQAIACLPR